MAERHSSNGGDLHGVGPSTSDDAASVNRIDAGPIVGWGYYRKRGGIPADRVMRYPSMGKQVTGVPEVRAGINPTFTSQTYQRLHHPKSLEGSSRSG